MSERAPFLHAVPPAESTKERMANDERDDRDAVPGGRRRGDFDPKFWIALAALLLTVIGALLGFLLAKIDTLGTAVQNTHDIVLVSTTKHDAENKELRERVEKLENAVDTQSKAYNFNFTTRLAVVEARVGIKQQQQTQKNGEP